MQFLIHGLSFSTAEPLPLKDICRRVIRQRVGKSRLGRVPELNLPTALKAYLLYQDRAS